MPQTPQAIGERLRLAAHVSSRLSHDVGNLLTSILGFSELALTQVQPGSLAHQYLTEVWTVARGGADWLKQVNYFCRRGAPEFTPCSLPGALAELEARLDPATPRWQVELPADLPAIACDTESLREALRAVLENASEAAGAAGAVQVRACAVTLDTGEAAALLGSAAAGQFVEITVTDSGRGLSPDTQERLWHDFYYSTKPRHRGLGLLVVYGIVNRFGGGLRIGTAANGGGAVYLYWPAAADPVPVESARLLVVDDDPQVLVDARRVLEPSGYRVTVAAAATEALLAHQRAAEPFDLTLLAVHLPHLTGPQLARRLLLRDPQASFLFLFAPAGPALPPDGLLSPATMVHKPLAAPALLQAVAAALRGSKRAMLKS